MKTEIIKSYSWGFALTEQDLRRIVQVVLDSFGKIHNASPPKFTINLKLKDGSVVNAVELEDVFLLENSGEKTINAVGLHWELGLDGENPTQKVDIDFQNGTENKKNWDSVSYLVLGSTRDWAFVTASEIDERLKRTKQIAWESIFAKKWIFSALMLLFTFIVLLTSAYFTPQDQYHITLDKMYGAGQLKDPIDALIVLERLKAEKSHMTAIYPILVTYIVLGGLIAIFTWVLPKVSPSYNFCWGDYTIKYEKTKKLRTAFWTLIVIGLIVAITANFLSKKIGI